MNLRLLLIAITPSVVSAFGIVHHDTTFHLHGLAVAAKPLWHQVAPILGAYKQNLMEHPLTTKMLTGGTLAVCGDAIAQNQQKDGSEYDTNRALSFGVFDMSYRALQHYSFPFLVNHCHGQFLGSLAAIVGATQWAPVMEETLGSQLVIVPLLYYPVFFALTGFLQGLTVEASVDRAKETFLPLMQRNLLFWIPIQFVQFGFVPDDLQIPFLSCAGLAWTFILSVFAGSAKNYQQPSATIVANSHAQTVEVADHSSTTTSVPSDFVTVER